MMLGDDARCFSSTRGGERRGEEVWSIRCPSLRLSPRSFLTGRERRSLQGQLFSSINLLAVALFPPTTFAPDSIVRITIGLIDRDAPYAANQTESAWNSSSILPLLSANESRWTPTLSSSVRWRLAKGVGLSNLM